MKEKTLIELDTWGGLFLTDKEFSHGFLSVYEPLFAPLRDKAINIFEAGYWYGGSSELWKRYFTKAQIRSIDIRKPPAIKEAMTGHVMRQFIPPSGRVHLDLMSTYALTEEYFKDFPLDIVIEDGSHLLADQVFFVDLVYPLIRTGGMLIIEDVQNLDKARKVFDGLGVYYDVVDNRAKTKVADSVLLIFKK